MTDPIGNSEFCFSLSLNVPLGNSLFPLGSVIKCLLLTLCGVPAGGGGHKVPKLQASATKLRDFHESYHSGNTLETEL